MSRASIVSIAVWVLAAAGCDAKYVEAEPEEDTAEELLVNMSVVPPETNDEPSAGVPLPMSDVADDEAVASDAVAQCLVANQATQEAIAAQQALTLQAIAAQQAVPSEEAVAQPELATQAAVPVQPALAAEQALAAQQALAAEDTTATEELTAQDALAAQQALAAQDAIAAQLAAQQLATGRVRSRRNASRSGVAVPTDATGAAANFRGDYLGSAQTSGTTTGNGTVTTGIGRTTTGNGTVTTGIPRTPPVNGTAAVPRTTTQTVVTER